MRIILLLLISFSVSCQVSKPTGSEKQMTMTMDLSSINLSKSQRLIPATFETISETMTVIDKVVKDGYYTEEKKTLLIKDGYKTMRPIINEGMITFKSDTLMRYNGFQEAYTEERTKVYSIYQYCPTCDKQNGISFKKVRKNLGPIDAKEGMPYEIEVSRLILVKNATVVPVYSEGSKTITVTGTKAELQELLAHPKLEGVKYEMKRL